MKKICLVLFISVFALSCSDEIETNTPVIQGSVNNEFFRAQPAEATINADGSVKLIGTNGSRTITLQMSSAEEGQYVLGADLINQATFLNFEQNLYLAGTGMGDGMIEITENAGAHLSGTFYFNGISGQGDTLNFQKGVFFEVPITNASGGEEVTGNSMSADIGETPFETNIVEGNELEGVLTVTGATQDVSIGLQFPTNITVGDHPLSVLGTQTATYTVGATEEAAETGNLTITFNDPTLKMVKGTFEFITAESGTEIINGEFQVTYQ